MIYSTRSRSVSPGNELSLSSIQSPDGFDGFGLQLSASSGHQHDLELSTRILTRIETRLPCRIRNLTVLTSEHAVVLTGVCSTFYTKQLAQHVAMGALDYEQLINNIEVRVTK